jgi:hypothetical protein
MLIFSVVTMSLGASPQSEDWSSGTTAPVLPGPDLVGKGDSLSRGCRARAGRAGQDSGSPSFVILHFQVPHA